MDGWMTVRSGSIGMVTLAILRAGVTGRGLGLGVGGTALILRGKGLDGGAVFCAESSNVEISKEQ